jgi:methionyl aminopeptidase
MQTRIKTSQELDNMRLSGRMLARVLNYLKSQVSDGMSTLDIANLAKAELKSLGGQPTFLGYLGFPNIICISLNEEVVHGIPRKNKIIHDGDIISLDFGVTYNSMITDGAISFIVGQKKIQKAHQLLVDRTKNSLYEGIGVLKDNIHVGDISHAIESYLQQFGYGIVKDLVGHGVGHHLHEEPNIPNYGPAHKGPILKSGMTIAIEPMVTMGTDQVVMEDDGWTILTADNSWSAHFEHTVLILEDYFEILTEE